MSPDDPELGSPAGPPGAASPDDVTRLIAASGGEGPEADHARERLLRMVYDELHRMARSRMRGERAAHTLSATALVHEAYIRLFRTAGLAATEPLPWSNRAAFFGSAATAMRRILIDHARARATKKRSGSASAPRGRISLDLLEVSEDLDPLEILALDEAISRLESRDERAASVVRLRFFAGLELAEVAELQEVSLRTVKRDWEFARAFLQQALEQHRAS